MSDNFDDVELFTRQYTSSKSDESLASTNPMG